jgi:hypothetical protein
MASSGSHHCEWIPGIRKFHLFAGIGYLLPEIALSANQADEYDRQRQIGT